MNPSSPQASLDRMKEIITMLQEELASTNREVLLLTLELETRVEQRTAQLSEANKHLTKEVAERKRAEEKVKKLNADLARRAMMLERANEELEAFTYSVSHDLRAPLRHIAGFSAILFENMEGKLDQESRECIGTIDRATKKMNRLIEDLLSFSRMSRQELRKKLMDPNGMVRDVLHDLQPDMRDRNIEWSISHLPKLYADPAMIRLVFSNLLSNAIKYTQPRNPAAIELGSKSDNADDDIIFIRDNGVGFDERHIDKLFGVFQRLHSEREFQGTGIGLANVKRIVERHGGRAWAEGRVNEGATFYFSMPHAAKASMR